MIRIAIGYVAVVVVCAVLILLNPMDFMGRDAREAKLNERLQGQTPTDLALGDAEIFDTSGIETLVAEALADGKTAADIDQIVNAAVADGSIEVPLGLTTTEGRVDTSVILAGLQAVAQGDEFGQGDLSEPTVAVEGGTLALQAATEDVLYIVRAGDSLGALALRFYGDANLHGAIFKANRQVMDTPESLRPGLKLLIPARSGL